MSEEKFVIGVVKEIMNKFVLVSDEGHEYKLYAINPWEAVSTDFNSNKFVPFIGKKVKATGRINNSEIWAANLIDLDENLTNTDESDLIFNRSLKKKQKR
ncbi:MAG: hypothetical protein JXA54_15375 [Candidatus Heimdallarchaeota archaeon]|nr:hypothetical protein [Candidatus Heimdallarchaeota archaeon]